MARAGPVDTVAIVSETVRLLRKDKQLSQEELAHLAGVDRTYVSQVERSLRNITITVLARLAFALNVTPDQLLIPPSLSKKGASTRRRRGG
jgi:transcriptional regulator with XRE-family HTH domain